MKIALAQINCIVGDMPGNTQKIIDACKYAKQQGAEIIITPELALTGYPPKDLLLQETFSLACDYYLKYLLEKIPEITLVVGHPNYTDNKLYNAASVLRNGQIVATYYKNTLSRSPYFNETQYFDSGTSSCIFELAGIRFGINICADFWQHKADAEIKQPDIDVLLVLSASPYHIYKQVSRHKKTRRYIEKTKISVICVNLTGGQDELVFDGASFAMNAQAELTQQLEAFSETVEIVQLEHKQPAASKLTTPQPIIAHIYQALCLGVKDYVNKNGFPGVLLGLSGGIDSALTLAIAVDALGSDKVQTVMMSTQYTSDISLHDAQEMAQILDVKYHAFSIETLFELCFNIFATEFKISPSECEATTMPENLQARIRGMMLMALSNQTGSIVLTTGNRSELAVGYCTLYGDMAGSLAVLKDVSKTQVYQLCHYRNKLGPVIPKRIITRAPSAELKPNQTDQDSLPPYDILDQIIEAYVDHHQGIHDIIARNINEADVHRIIQLIHRNEYKRYQAPPGIRVTPSGFGKSWQYPATAKYDFNNHN